MGKHMTFFICLASIGLRSLCDISQRALREFMDILGIFIYWPAQTNPTVNEDGVSEWVLANCLPTRAVLIASHYEFILLNLFALLAQRIARGKEERETESGQRRWKDNSFSFCCNIKQLKDLRWKLIATVCGSHCKCSAVAHPPARAGTSSPVQRPVLVPFPVPLSCSCSVPPAGFGCLSAFCLAPHEAADISSADCGDCCRCCCCWGREYPGREGYWGRGPRHWANCWANAKFI